MNSPWQYAAAVSVVLLLLGRFDLHAHAEFNADAEAASSSRACASCHRFADRVSHPVDVRGAPVAGLPLENGNVTCLTCHDERALEPDHERRGSAMLRLPARALCASCHEATRDLRSKVSHGLALRRAHLQTSQPNDGALGRLDAETRACLGCHDGAVASEPAVWKRGSSVVRRRASSHPIGDPYRALGRRRTSLRPPASLPAEVRLPGGMVGCGSCHSYYSRHENMLSLPTRRGRLCLSCHIK